jgi:hypothetical protein
VFDEEGTGWKRVNIIDPSMSTAPTGSKGHEWSAAARRFGEEES